MAMASYSTKQGNRSPILRATLRNAAGSVVNLTAAQSVIFRMRLESGEEYVVDRAMSIEDALGGVVSITFTSEETAVAGRYFAEIDVVYADGLPETFPNKFYIVVTIDKKL
jgi:hypothetical protein